MPNKKSPIAAEAGKPLKVRFGGLVQAHRTRLQMTQMQLSNKTGLSRDMVAKIEKGVTGARFQIIQALADALNVEPCELFVREDAARSKTPPDLEDFVARLATLPASDVAWIRGIVEAALRGR